MSNRDFADYKFCSASLKQVLVFPQQHKFLALIEDCDFGGDNSVRSLFREIDNLKGRVQSVSGMHFL
jgi:hypothetical protein